MIASIALFLASQSAADDVTGPPEPATICRMYYNDKMADLALPINQQKTDEIYRTIYFKNDKKGALRKTCAVYFAARQDEAEYVLNRDRGRLLRSDGAAPQAPAAKRSGADRAQSSAGPRKDARRAAAQITTTRAAARDR